MRTIEGKTSSTGNVWKLFGSATAADIVILDCILTSAAVWGRIINVSSYAAKSGGVTAGTAYAASKGGMISLTFSLAAETVKQGITVNGIAPAWVKTPMVTDLSEAEQARTISKIPVGRFCEPQEFAHIVRFLASDLSGFITGEVVDLNGGVHFD